MLVRDRPFQSPVDVRGHRADVVRAPDVIDGLRKSIARVESQVASEVFSYRDSPPVIKGVPPVGRRLEEEVIRVESPREQGPAVRRYPILKCVDVPARLELHTAHEKVIDRYGRFA